MSTPEEQLREAFQAHEGLAPDAAAVYARVQELSRTYKWRRRGAAAAGGIVVGAGLIAGIVNLPGVLPGEVAPVNHQPAASAPASPAPTLSAAEMQRAIEEYMSVGYDVNNAVELAQLWHMSGDLDNVKAKAGRLLLAGQPLPVQPSAATADPTLNAFFSAGYDYDDAAQLAKLWKLKSPGDAKTEGGKRLLAGETLPIKPGSATPPPAKPPTLEEKRVKAFFDAGYTTSDAAKLADLWHTTSPYDAKVEGGKRLLAGKKLPIAP